VPSDPLISGCYHGLRQRNMDAPIAPNDQAIAALGEYDAALLIAAWTRCRWETRSAYPQMFWSGSPRRRWGSRRD
jgi:hypothetical protein